MSQIPVRALLIVSAMVVGTLITRFLPFFVFPAGKKTPAFVDYLGKTLPFATMGLLVVYCLKGIHLTLWASGNPVCRADCSSSLEEGKFSSQHWYWNCILYVSGAGSIPVI